MKRAKFQKVKTKKAKFQKAKFKTAIQKAIFKNNDNIHFSMQHKVFSYIWF